MVILGGLEIVVGGYLIHRYHKNKDERKRLDEEAHRQDAPAHRPHRQQQNHQRPPPPKRPHTSYPSQPPPGPARKEGYYAPPPHPQHDPYAVQPIRRQQSFASLSQMPVANGYQTQQQPPPQPQPFQSQSYLHHPQSFPSQPYQQSQPIQAQTQPRPNYPYYNTGFSASYPSFDPASDQMSHDAQVPGGRYQGSAQTHSPQSPHVHFDVSSSPQPGERDDDPPPPYRP